MKKRILKAAFSAVMISTLLLGCGSKTEEVTTPPKEETQTEDTKTEAPATDAGLGGSLVYWSMWESTEPQGKAIKEAVDKFSSDTGVTVDLQFKGRTGIREGLQPALDAGTNIDLFDEDIDRVNTTWAKYIMDLEDLSKKANYEATANSALISACRDLGAGRLKSIPYQPNVFAFFYNQEAFDKAGITEVPKTWAELDAACAKLKTAGYIPITSDDAYVVCNFGYHMSRLVGLDGTNDIVTNKKWDDPAVLKTAQAYEEFAKKGYFSELIASNVWPAGQNTELALGEAAIYLNGSWLPNEVKDIADPNFKWGCFSYPAVDGGKDGVEAANYGSQVLAINTKSQNPEAAFKLIEYITKGEFDQKMSEMSVGIPADSTNSVWPEKLTSVKSVMDSLTTRYTWAAGGEANPDMTPIIKENFMKLCGGSITAQQFVDNLKAASK